MHSLYNCYLFAPVLRILQEPLYVEVVLRVNINYLVLKDYLLPDMMRYCKAHHLVIMPAFWSLYAAFLVAYNGKKLFKRVLVVDCFAVVPNYLDQP